MKRGLGVHQTLQLSSWIITLWRVLKSFLLLCPFLVSSSNCLVHLSLHLSCLQSCLLNWHLSISRSGSLSSSLSWSSYSFNLGSSCSLFSSSLYRGGNLCCSWLGRSNRLFSNSLLLLISSSSLLISSSLLLVSWLSFGLSCSLLLLVGWLSFSSLGRGLIGICIISNHYEFLIWNLTTSELYQVLFV